MHKSLFVFSIFASIAVAAGICRADDLTVVSNVITNGQPSGADTNYISSDHIRTSNAQGTEMIIDLKAGVMTNINDKKKTYYVVTKQDMADMQAKMAERMNDPKMKQGMAFMQGMSTSMSASTEVKKTGVTRKVAGYSCEEWLISMGPMMSMTECVTSELKYPVQSWEALAAFNESMRKSMSGFGPSAKSGEEFAEKLKSVKGFPVASSTTVGVAGIGKTTISSEVTEVRRTPIPASTWDVPAGFSKVENPMLRAFQEHGH
jgi:signal recognition particle GTPase